MAHVSCNQEQSDDVNDFRDFLVLDAGASEHPEVQRLLKGKVGRKIEKPGASMARKLKPVVLPGMTETGIYLGSVTYMQVDAQMVVRVVRNIARCLYYSEVDELIPLETRIAVIVLDNSNSHVPELREMVMSLGKTETFGDDVFRYKREFEPGAMACVFDFYKSRRFLCHALWDIPDSQTATGLL